jgi:HK97 family phage portal protein
VAQEGSVFYQVSQDNLSGVPSGLDAIPASEIIHDRWNTLFHPLCGLSPIYACGLAALQGREIQRHGTSFFQNGARPGGIITAPGTIKDEHAQRLKTYWEDNFSGVNAGKVAVLGDGLSYEALAFNAHDSQLIEQLKLTAEVICGSFGVPSYKVGVGQAPTYNNVEALAQQYYSDALQIHIESIELCLDEGLELPKPLGTEFDLDDLLRMDSASLVKTLTEGVTGGVFKPDEARKRANLGKVMGGDAVYLQQQNFSLEALAKRDAKEDPFAKGGEAAPAATAPAEAPPSDNDNELTSLEFDDLLEKGALGHATR